jgi:putative transposase
MTGSKKIKHLSLAERRALIAPAAVASISVRRQCAMLGVNRSSVYYAPRPVSTDTHAVMHLLEEIYTQWPFYGARRMSKELKVRGACVGRKRAGRLMRLMGLEAVVPQRNTSKPHPTHPVYPYLLRGVQITHTNQVWSMDITYIRLRHGFAYLAAVMDWHSRYVLSWRLSNTLTSDFCVDAVNEALEYGTPEMFNTDQGSQFTSEDFVQVLQDRGIQISMDGRGRALDNIFVERLWRSVKYENVYLKGYETIPDAAAGLQEYFNFYNVQRHHQSLDYHTPWLVYAGLEVAQHPNPVA